LCLLDAVNSKPFARAVRRREPNAPSTTKFDPNRKPVPQKNKCFDKRPRPRGQFYYSGKENTKVRSLYKMRRGGTISNTAVKGKGIYLVMYLFYLFIYLFASLKFVIGKAVGYRISRTYDILELLVELIVNSKSKV
jgi:hypothetical protein